MSKTDEFIEIAEQLGGKRVPLAEKPDDDGPEPMVFELSRGAHPCRLALNECCGRDNCINNELRLEVAAADLAPPYRYPSHGIERAAFEDRSLGFGPCISLTPESGVNRAMKALAVDREVQTGDAAFDEKVYIDTDVLDGEVQAALASRPARAAAMRLVDMGVRRVRLHAGSATAEVAPGCDDFLKPGLVNACLDDLTVLAQATPQTLHLATGELRTWPSVMTIAAPIPFWLMHVWSNWRGEIMVAPPGPSWLIASTAIAIFFVIALYVARGHSDSSQMAFWATCFFAICGAYPAGHVATNLNILLDGSSPTTIHGRVETYDLDAEEPSVVLRTAEGESVLLTGDAAEMADSPLLAINAQLAIARHSGRFGWPWIAASSIQQP